MQTLPPKTLEFSARHEYGYWLTSASQFDFNTRFRLIDEAGETGSGFGDGVLPRHTSTNVHHDVQKSNRHPYGASRRWNDFGRVSDS